MIRSGAIAVAVFTGLIACAPPLSTRLKQSVQFAYMRAPCGKIVAMQWPYGFPVPSDAPGQFKFFFYPIVGSPPKDPIVDEPTVDATIELGSDKVLACDLITDRPAALVGNRWPAQSRRLSSDKFDAQADRLYDQTEKVAAVYFAKRPATPADKAAAADYMKLFEAAAEPPLLPYYYRLNPAFWEWVRSTAGRSIPKAS